MAKKKYPDGIAKLQRLVIRCKKSDLEIINTICKKLNIKYSDLVRLSIIDYLDENFKIYNPDFLKK